MNPDMEEHLLCNLCEDFLRDPKILTCGHQYCTECLRNEREKNGLSWTIICVVCLKETKVPENGVGGLPTNFLVVAMLEQHAGKEAPAQSPAVNRQSRRGTMRKQPTMPESIRPTKVQPRSSSRRKSNPPPVDREAEIRDEVNASIAILSRNKTSVANLINALHICVGRYFAEEQAVRDHIQGYFRDLRSHIDQKEAILLGDFDITSKRNKLAFESKTQSMDNIAKVLGAGLDCMTKIIANPSGQGNFYEYYRENKDLIENGDTQVYVELELCEKLKFIPAIDNFEEADLIGELQTHEVDLDSMLRSPEYAVACEVEYMEPIKESPSTELKRAPLGASLSSDKYNQNLAVFDAAEISPPPQHVTMRNRSISTVVAPVIPPRIESKRGSLYDDVAINYSPNTRPQFTSPKDLAIASQKCEAPFLLSQGTGSSPNLRRLSGINRSGVVSSPDLHQPPPRPVSTLKRNSTKKKDKVSNVEDMCSYSPPDYPTSLPPAPPAPPLPPPYGPMMRAERPERMPQPFSPDNSNSRAMQSTRMTMDNPNRMHKTGLGDLSQALSDSKLFKSRGRSFDVEVRI